MQSVSSVAKNGIEKYVRSQSDGLQFLLKKKLGDFLEDLKKQDQQL
jgi:hypothetical protein